MALEKISSMAVELTEDLPVEPKPEECPQCGEPLSWFFNEAYRLGFSKNPWLLGECPVCRAQRKKEELLKEKKAEQERLDFLTGYSRLEKKYLNKTFGNSNLREGKDYSTGAAYEECLAYAKDFPWPLERGSGLLILGSTGCGKNNMAAALLCGVPQTGLAPAA